MEVYSRTKGFGAAHAAKIKIGAAFTFLVGAVLLLGGCGKLKTSELVDQLSVSTSTQDGDGYLELTVQLNDNYMLPSYEFPIKKDGEEYGKVTIENQNWVTVSANLSEISGKEGGSGVLPNGDSIPVSGFGSEDVISFKAGKNVDVYIAAANGFAMAGFALKVAAFDEFLGETIGQATLCHALDLGNDVDGSACIFSGAAEDASGIAVFANTTEAVLNLGDSLLDSNPDSGIGDWVRDRSGKKKRKRNRIRFVEKSPGSSVEKKMQNQLKQVHDRYRGKRRAMHLGRAKKYR